MKYLLSGIFIFLFLIGCGEEKKENKNISTENLNKIDTSDIKTTPVENPGQNFLMRYKFELNKEYNYRIATITQNSQTMKLDSIISQNMRQDIVYLLNIKPVQIESDSVFEINCIINSIKLDANANGQIFSYQSNVTKDSAELVRFSNYEALVKNSFSLRVDNKGSILEVFKTDKIVDRYLTLNKLGDSVTSEQKNVLREQISQGAIRPLLSQIFRSIPEKIVAKDSVWTISQPVSQFLVFQIQTNNIYSINSLEKYNDSKVAVINAKLNSKISGNQKVTERGVNYEFSKPVSEASGKIYFNVDEGYVLKSKTKTKLSVSYSMEGITPMGKQKGSSSEVMEYTNIVELL